MSLKSFKAKMKKWQKEYLKITSELFAKKPPTPEKEVNGNKNKKYKFRLHADSDSIVVFVQVPGNIWSYVVCYEGINQFIKLINEISYLPEESKKILLEWIENIE